MKDFLTKILTIVALAVVIFIGNCLFEGCNEGSKAQAVTPRQSGGFVRLGTVDGNRVIWRKIEHIEGHTIVVYITDGGYSPAMTAVKLH